MNTQYIAEKILNEKDPILRVIWAEGFDYIYLDDAANTMRLYKNKAIVREINLFDFRSFCRSLKIIRSHLRVSASDLQPVPIDQLPIHEWVSEGDGSAQRLRDFLNEGPSCEIRFKNSELIQ